MEHLSVMELDASVLRMTPTAKQARYESLLVKYEQLAADRAVWIERAHGREEGWPLPPNPQDDWSDDWFAE